VEVEVDGAIPKWLDGVYLRNGPGELEGMKHLFDGYAILHKLRVSEGRAFAMHKFLDTEAYRYRRETGKMRWREFGTPITHDGIGSILREYSDYALGMFGVPNSFTDNASVNVVPHPEGRKGSALAITETINGMYEVDVATLRTVKKARYSDGVPGTLLTAHPHVTVDGDIVNVSNEVGRGYHVFRQRRGSMAREEVAFVPHIDGLAPAWIHDFALAANYAVIVESPLYINLGAMMLGKDTEHLFMDWRPERPTRVHVVSLKTGHVTTKLAPPFWTFHFQNAFESDDGSELYVDMAKFETPNVLNQLLLEPLLSEDGEEIDESHPERMTISLDPASPDQIQPEAIKKLIANPGEYGNYYEFPTISPLKHCVEYRYAYGIAAARPTNVANAIAKHDIVEGKSLSWFEEGAVPGEPRFIPRPGATDEDDGVVLSLCTGADGKAFYIFLDGKTFQEVGRAKLPYGATYGFHGSFLSSA